jgi:hypothetical protein
MSDVEEETAEEMVMQGFRRIPFRPAASPIASPEMTFPQAMERVIAGKKVTKVEWGGKSQYVVLMNGFLSIKRPTGYHQLIVSEGDMRGEDWIVVEKGGAEERVE